jgi:hypothetical protein
MERHIAVAKSRLRSARFWVPEHAMFLSPEEKIPEK